MKTHILYITLIFSLWFLSSCNSTRHIPEGSYMLKKNIVKVHDVSLFSLENSTIEPYIRQKNNSKILGIIPLKLMVYNMTAAIFKKPDINFGEAPVELDTSLVKKSVEQIRFYLQNKGYLDCVVSDSIHHYKKKKARVTYHIYLNQPYTLQNISVRIEDDALRPDVIKSNEKTAIRKGQIFDLELFEADRKQLVSNMKNRGYYFFSDEHIRYEVDTFNLTKKVDVYHKILNPSYYKQDSLIKDKHLKYYFKNIIVSDELLRDDLDTSGLVCSGGYCFTKTLYNRISHRFLKQNLLFKPNDLFSQSSIDLTYSRLSSLKMFKGINIKLIPKTVDSSKTIDAFVYTPFLPKNSVSIETNGTNRGGNLGVQGAINFKNRNPFKNAETLELRLRGGLEAQRSTGIAIEDQEQIARVFNTLEYGIESKLNIPILLFPFWKEKTSLFRNPKTEIHGLFNYQKITWFMRDVIGLDWSYTFSTTPKNAFLISLADINVVKVNKEPEFEKILQDLNNPFFTNTYNDHFIIGSRFQYSYNSRDGNTRKNYYSYRTGIEGSGNVLRQLYELNTKDTLPGKVFGIQFAQYVRADVDLRIFNVLNKGMSAVYRISAAAGLPLKNSVSLPFEKSFFSGGANGIRAWRIRSLGPGSFNQNVSSFYKIGDMQLEANAELRFDIISIFKGAFFVDAGNIWLVNEDKDRLNGDFKLNRFYKEIAIGVGAGIRLDFDFFIIRFDYGIQFRDPSLTEGERWLFQKKDVFFDQNQEKYKMGANFNIGIGYPF